MSAHADTFATVMLWVGVVTFGFFGVLFTVKLNFVLEKMGSAARAPSGSCSIARMSPSCSTSSSRWRRSAPRSRSTRRAA